MDAWRGPFHFICAKDKFFQLILSLVGLHLPQNGASTIKRIPTEFSCPFICESCVGKSEGTIKKKKSICVCEVNLFSLGIFKKFICSFASGDDAESCRRSYTVHHFHRDGERERERVLCAVYQTYLYI